MYTHVFPAMAYSSLPIISGTLTSAIIIMPRLLYGVVPSYDISQSHRKNYYHDVTSTLNEVNRNLQRVSARWGKAGSFLNCIKLKPPISVWPLPTPLTTSITAVQSRLSSRLRGGVLHICKVASCLGITVLPETQYNYPSVCSSQLQKGGCQPFHFSGGRPGECPWKYMIGGRNVRGRLI